MINIQTIKSLIMGRVVKMDKRKMPKGHGENIRKSLIGKKGKLARNWKGGIKKSDGYIWIYLPNNKFHFKGNYVRRSHLVWFAYHGEIIENPFMIHHINEIRDDDRIENLQKITFSKHQKIHSKTRNRDMGGRFTK